MFGYACSETEELMPAPIHFSHKILRMMAKDRKAGSLKGIEPDSKSQVTMLYESGSIPLRHLQVSPYQRDTLIRSVIEFQIW